MVKWLAPWASDLMIVSLNPGLAISFFSFLSQKENEDKIQRIGGVEFCKLVSSVGVTLAGKSKAPPMILIFSIYFG